jgi:hypothetical protein
MSWFRRAKRVRPFHNAPRLEELETRCLLAAPTAVEQVFLERLNDARANPAAYGQSIGVDLSGVAPRPPLAFNTQLIDASLGHSQYMNATGQFNHEGIGDGTPGSRVNAAGFSFINLDESIAAGYSTPDSALAALIIDAGVPDLGHRNQLLGIDAAAATEQQVGIGIVLNGGGPYQGDFYTIDSASDADGRAFLTGVVYRDTNGNGRYDAGEGLGGVTISVPGVGSVTTFDSGGYSIRTGPGTFSVTASGGALGTSITTQVSVGSSNVRLNFTPAGSSATSPASGGSITPALVAKFYTRVLGRTASDGEINYWVTTLQGQPPSVLANDIERAPEARLRVVTGWYQTFLGRTPAGGEPTFWVNQFASGATEEQVLAGILSSAEYYIRVQGMFGGQGDVSFVTALYQQFLGRAANTTEISYWVGRLPELGRGGVAMDFTTSPEHRSTVIAGFYAQLLLRTPSPGELTYWVNSGLDLLTIRIDFETAPEFVNS